MADGFGLILILASVALAAYSLFSLWRIQHALNSRLAYIWLAVVAFLVIAVSTLDTGSFVFVAVVVPVGVFAFEQIPLVVFRARQEGQGNAGRDALRHGALIILAAVLMNVGVDLDGPTWTTPLRDRLVFLTMFIGIFPLLASSYLLMKAGWKVAKLWGVGLNPITVAAVLPVFVQKYPTEGLAPARRFLFWLAVTWAPALVDSILGTEDTLHAAGYSIFTVGGLALMGATVWLLTALARLRWEAVKRPLATMAVSAALASAGIMMFGDIVFDRHALGAAGRTWADRAFGCAGNQRHATLLLEWSKRPVAPRLKPVPASVTTAAIPGTHDVAILRAHRQSTRGDAGHLHGDGHRVDSEPVTTRYKELLRASNKTPTARLPGKPCYFVGNRRPIFSNWWHTSERRDPRPGTDR